MNAMLTRLILAAAMLVALAAMTNAHAARPMPAYAEVVITFAGQSFGFGGPLRQFEVNDSGGKVVLDPRTLESAPYTPLQDLDVSALRAGQYLAGPDLRQPVADRVHRNLHG